MAALDPLDAKFEQRWADAGLAAQRLQQHAEHPGEGVTALQGRISELDAKVEELEGVEEEARRARAAGEELHNKVGHWSHAEGAFMGMPLPVVGMEPRCDGASRSTQCQAGPT